MVTLRPKPPGAAPRERLLQRGVLDRLWELSLLVEANRFSRGYASEIRDAERQRARCVSSVGLAFNRVVQISRSAVRAGYFLARNFTAEVKKRKEVNFPETRQIEINPAKKKAIKPSSAVKKRKEFNLPETREIEKRNQPSDEKSDQSWSTEMTSDHACYPRGAKRV